MAQQESYRDESDRHSSGPRISRRTFIGKSGATVLAVGGAGSFLAACGGSGSKDVVVLTWGNPQTSDQLATGFKRATGLNLVAVPGANDADFYNKVVAGGSSEYDIVITNIGYVQKYVQKGLIERLDLSQFPNTSQLYPQFLTGESWKSYYLIQSPNLMWAVPHQWGSYGMTYLTSAYPSPPTSWHDLWKAPKGKVQMVNDPVAVPALALRLTGIPWDQVFSATPAQLDAAVALLRQLKPFQLPASNALTIDEFRTGETVIGLNFSIGFYYTINQAVHKNITGSTVPKEGIFGATDGQMLLKAAPHRANALKYINYNMGKEAQIIYWLTGNDGGTSNRLATEAILAMGGANRAGLLAVQGANPDLAATMVELAEPDSPAAWTNAWNQVIA